MFKHHILALSDLDSREILMFSSINVVVLYQNRISYSDKFTALPIKCPDGYDPVSIPSHRIKAYIETPPIVILLLF